MSKRVHIVPCDNGHGLWRIGLIIGVFLGCWWFWHHVIEPIGHFLLVFLWWLGQILMWGAIAIGGLSILLASSFIVVCLVERRRHVHSNSGSWVAGVSRAGMARKDVGAPLHASSLPPHPTFSAGAIESLPPRKPDSLIRCEDDVFMLTHGITPPDYEGL